MNAPTLTQNTIPLPDFEPCADCGRPVRWSEEDGEYYHARGEDPRARHGGGCWLNSEEPVHPLTEENEKPRSYLMAAIPVRKRVPNAYRIGRLREIVNGSEGTREEREVASDALLRLLIEQRKVTNPIRRS